MQESISALFLFLLPGTQSTSKPSIKPIQPPKSDREVRKLRTPVQTIRYEWCVLSDEPNSSGEYQELERPYVDTITFDPSGMIPTRPARLISYYPEPEPHSSNGEFLLTNLTDRVSNLSLS